MKYVDIIKASFDRQLPKDTLFPSEFGICVRRSYFERTEVFQKINVSEAMETGVVYHEAIEQKLRDELKCETEKEIQGELNGIKISGRIDAICGNDLLEIKTVSIFVNIPKSYHIDQATVYWLLTNKQYNIYLIYIKRNDLQIREIMLDKSVLEAHIPNIMKFIDDYKKLIETGDYRQVKMADSTFCKNCYFTKKCYAYW
ncbi:CRISPR/Cas system associated [Stygiolobus rod-shaped virus]|uniref:DUF83 domain-containing protein n=1 Tax=Stygiolobus rod-shaped virus TaxID=537009 RepID=B6EFB5_9VIRU|nr:CRISPR/Cas system associated [Stygiolobus rod-shaped virus]CAQ58450.1 hypothetical protein [Stygiolobus rod-shaped virus]